MAASILAALALVAPAAPQAQDNAELERIALEDRQDRVEINPLQPGARERLAQRDAGRVGQVMAIAKADGLHTVIDIERAVVLILRSTRREDLLHARDLACVALGKGSWSSLFAQTHDRVLLAGKRKQRFGTQAAYKGGKLTLEPLDMGDQASVTDSLRLDLYVPPLETVNKVGVELAPRVAQHQFESRSKERNNADFLRQVLADYDSQRLQDMAEGEKADVQQVLAWYQADLIRGPWDYENAALVLGLRQDARTQLLAGELAMVAVMRGRKSAWPLFTDSWDRYCEQTGEAKRYVNRSGLLPAVRRFFTAG